MDSSALGTVGGGGDLHQLDAVRLAAMGGCRQQRPGHLFVGDWSAHMDSSALGTGGLHQLETVRQKYSQQRPGHLFVAHTAVRQGKQTKIQSVLAWSPLCSTHHCATGKQTKIQSVLAWSPLCSTHRCATG